MFPTPNYDSLIHATRLKEEWSSTTSSEAVKVVAKWRQPEYVQDWWTDEKEAEKMEGVTAEMIMAAKTKELF